MSNSESEFWSSAHAGAVVLGSSIVLAIMLWVLQSKFEAAAYNRLTGASVTTWDAMWVDLRVQSEPKK